MFSKEVAQKLVPLVGNPEAVEALEVLHKELTQELVAQLVVETSEQAVFRLQGKLALLGMVKDLPTIVTDTLNAAKQQEQADKAWKDQE